MGYNNSVNYSQTFLREPAKQVITLKEGEKLINAVLICLMDVWPVRKYKLFWREHRSAEVIAANYREVADFL